jgi:hypothetical protein
MFCNNAYAENFKCEIHSNLSYIIKVDNSNEQVLATVNPETGKLDDNSVIYNFPSSVLNGEVIEFRGDNSNIFKLIVLRNSKKGDDFSFRGIYFQGSYVHSIKIDTWDEDVPIYLYNDLTKEQLKGTCK